MDEEFVVRLLIKVSAKDEVEAVEEFIENINTYGLRAWIYMAENDKSKELFQVSGSGDSKRVNGL